MENRLNISRKLSSGDGSIIVAIDKYEHNGLFALLKQLYPNYDIVSVSVEHNKKGTQGDHFSFSNEYAIFVMPETLKELNRVEIPENEWEYSNLRNWGGESLREDAANCFYPIYVKDNQIIGFGNVCEDDFHPTSSNVLRDDGIIEIYPIDDEGIERKWRYARQTVNAKIKCTKNANEKCATKISQ
jgi:adenine-specific DNA-methyltransferase